MKIIEVPGPIMVKTRRSPKDEDANELKFKDWAENVIDYYSEGVKTLKQVRQVQKIIDALGSANGTVSLEDAEYDLLKAAMEAYPTKLPPVIVRQQLPFIDAVEKAQDVKKAT